MQFLYDERAGEASLSLNGENHKYLFKVRRLKEGDSLFMRNLHDDILYLYKIVTIDKKEALLALSQTRQDEKRSKSFHLFWCVIDPKVMEKTLPMLNQIGVSKITFIYCERSQKNFKIDHRRIRKILINSCQQCGRGDLMEIETVESLETVLQKHENISVLDFGGAKKWESIGKVLVGCEGGFSEYERELLKNCNKIAFDTDFILKSETAAVSIASKLLI